MVLREMGYASYAEYLVSPLWHRIRARLFNVCDVCICGKPATQAHHRSYKRKYLEGRGKIHKFIVPLCRDCHKQIEFEGSEKLSLGWANAKLMEIQAEAERRGIRTPGRARLSLKSQQRRHNKYRVANPQGGYIAASIAAEKLRVDRTSQTCAEPAP